MRNNIMMFLGLLAVCVPARAAELSDTYDKAIADVQPTVRATWWKGRLNSQALSPFEKLGSNLAAKFPKADIQFLKAKIANKKDFVGRQVAWVMLAKLANRKDARNVILQHINDDDPLRWKAILAISFMPTAVRKDAAMFSATRIGCEVDIMEMIELVGYIGDEKTVKFLNKFAKQHKTGVIHEAIIRTLNGLQEKIKQSASEQKVWTQAGVRFWRAYREVEQPIVPKMKYLWAAELVANSGVKCPVSFLRRKIKDGDITKRHVLAKDIMAIILAGVQKEPELVSDLDRVVTASSRRLRWDWAVISLVRIGNKAAMDIVYKQMKPDDAEKNKNIAETLATYGTKSAVAMLEKLSKDEKHKASWPVFELRLKRLKSRLDSKRTNPLKLDDKTSTRPNHRMKVFPQRENK